MLTASGVPDPAIAHRFVLPTSAMKGRARSACSVPAGGTDWPAALLASFERAYRTL